MKKEHIKSKPRAKFPKPLPRRKVVSALVDAYCKECGEIIINFQKEYRVELVDHLLACLDVLMEYVQTPEKHIWKKYSDLEEAFLKKHKSRLQLYRQKQLFIYYWPETAIMESDIMDAAEFNALPGDEQVLTEAEMEQFFKHARNFLSNERDYILLNEDPDDEVAKDTSKENQEVSGKDPKVNLSAQLLIIYYLLKALNIEPRGSTNISEVARLAHFLLGKKITVLSNSDIYKRLRKMPNIKSDKELIKDLQTIRPLFAGLDMRETVLQIDKEIGLARKEKLKKGQQREA